MLVKRLGKGSEKGNGMDTKDGWLHVGQLDKYAGEKPDEVSEYAETDMSSDLLQANCSMWGCTVCTYTLTVS